MNSPAPVEPKTYSIGYVAETTGLPVSTIRFYEREFKHYLEVPKTPGGHRRFRQDDIEKLKHIHALVHEQGRPLKEVKEALVSTSDPVLLRRDVDLLLDVFENLVQENLKLKQAVEDLSGRVLALEEERKRKRFKLF
ncbi:MAG: MerR family transcriptional regulator [Acidobacteriota bacterium]